MKAFFVTGVVSIALAAGAQSAAAQHPWQKLQMPTAAEVAKVWTAPPAEYGPEPYFGMNGPVTIESLSKDLDTIKAMGFHAVTVQAGRGMTQPYLSPEYFAFFKQFVEEAKKRELKIWIVDDAGYPSGFAGGKFTSEKPELRMQALTISDRIPVKGGEALNQSVGSNAVSAIAISTSGERTPVPLKDGQISWTAPARSDFTVAVVEHVFRTYPTRSDTNPTGQKDATQSLEDYLDPAATAQYLAFTHEGYYKAIPEYFGSTILGFRGDEPDYSIAGLPWTPKFFDTFQQIKGYDIRPYLGAILLGQPARGQTPTKLTHTELGAKGDYYDVFSQMFRDGFFKPQADWCAAHGVEYQVHLNHEEMDMELTRSEGDFMRDMKYVQVPGIDAIWHQIWTDTISDYPRLAASAAHIYGHPRAFTETFAAYRPTPDIDMARYILNEQMVRGVNLIEAMYFPSTRPANAPPPPRPLNAPPGATGERPRSIMRDPGWPALMDYVRRLSYVLSMGRPAASVALYLPSSSMWMNDKDSDDTFVSTERMLSERQIDFDIVNDDALAADMKVSGGTFTTLSANQYHAVVIPSASALSQVAYDRLKAFAKAGGKVLILRKTPSLIYGRTLLDARTATPADFAFAIVETSTQLAPTPTPPQFPPGAPPSTQEVPSAIEAALARTIPAHDAVLDSPDTAFRVLSRRLKDASVYFFFNESAEPLRRSVTLKTAGKTAEVWDAQTASITRMSAHTNSGSISFALELKPYETRLIVVR